MPLFRTQSAAKQTSLAPHDSKARLQDVTNRRRFMAKPCTPHLIPQAAQLFKIETANVGGRGVLPSRSLGGSRGPFSHVREWPPWCCGAHAAYPSALCAESNRSPEGAQKRSSPFRCVQLRKHSKAREKRYSFGYAVSFIFACYQILWTFPKSLYLCSRYLPLACG